ncbi:hypothetical protein EV702DRAFT_1046056 [Suillus placidus]|uniref:Uncharacterized protein n=1 Tax=Suillus placidus TaxID=48579 RepID=A0A9P6ZTF5_9AGAM|nr:hypothetical protein EV702DRAFT_1046056 [Suillus placidus]
MDQNIWTNTTLQTELRVLSFLLKDRVYPGNLWEIVGECTIEAKQEAVLLQHQSTCIRGPKGQRHVIVEHLLMEERKKRGQMEVSLYSQAIEYLQQHRMSRWLSQQPQDLLDPVHPEPVQQLREINATIGELLMERCSFVDGFMLSKPGLTVAHEDKRASVILNCVSPSLPLLSTWVAVDVQEAFYSAFHGEQACQAGLMTQSSAVNANHTYQHNIGLESLILQAKMRHAQAEIELYTVAIANAHEFDFSENISGHADQQYGLQLLMALQMIFIKYPYGTMLVVFRRVLISNGKIISTSSMHMNFYRGGSSFQNQELAIQYMTKSLEFRMWLAYGQKHNKLLKNAQCWTRVATCIYIHLSRLWTLIIHFILVITLVHRVRVQVMDHLATKCSYFIILFLSSKYKWKGFVTLLFVVLVNKMNGGGLRPSESAQPQTEASQDLGTQSIAGTGEAEGEEAKAAMCQG